jgi:hypothetical protein
MMQVIIFSMDRPPQLELLLRSYKEFVSEPEMPKIIYAPRGQYAGTYRIVQSLHVAQWYEEGETWPLKEALLEAIDEKIPYTMFLVDDDVFIRPFNTAGQQFKQFMQDDSIATLSLRLSPGLSYCYAYGTPMMPPEFQGSKFRWQNAPGDFGWVCSLDGNIYHTGQIYGIIKRVRFRTPNELEGAMMIGKLPQPYVATYDTPRLMNIPANRVQNIANNRCMHTQSTAWLNQQFAEGKRISMDNLRDHKAPSCHVEVEYKMEPCPGARPGGFYYE